MGKRHSLLAALGLMAIVASSGGCTFVAQTIGAIEGHEIVPAKFNGLEGKRVAVVCIDVNSLYGPGDEADLLARGVSTQLSQNVKNIKMVKQSEIHDWIDQQDQALVDFRNVGRGVKADMVIGIDLNSISTRDVGTLLQGKANIAVKVFDMSRPDEPVYEKPPTVMEFPEHGGRHVTENEANFRVMFLRILADKITKDFYAHDRTLDFGRDATYIGD
ncbi:MAG TPA: hypothetical protein VFB96_08655 [Pirellulaceae bacterium]|nr:hypothetical protein [Pirellulaceae bacterium]